MTWLIARRAALEALRDRSTLLMGLGFALALPLVLLVLVVRPLSEAADPALGEVLAFYLLVVGLPPTVSAVGIAAGQFAGEKERGILTPLLASPASNLAIFAGKVLGALIPPLLYAAMAEVVYVLGLAVLLGPGALRLLPLSLSLALVVLVPAVACFAAIVASLISSRVRTFNTAQQIGGLVLMPVWGAVFALAAKLQGFGDAGLVVAAAGLVLVDAALAVVAAATWRREEVLAQR
jgi:ABC-2 type transport system permease protein